MPHRSRLAPLLCLATLPLSTMTACGGGDDGPTQITPGMHDDAGASDGGLMFPDASPPEADATPPEPDAAPPAPDAAPPEPQGLPVLGNGAHAIEAVVLETISQPGDGLDVPRDLEFNPADPGELWVVNRADDSTTTYFDVGTPEQRADHRVDPYALHFMEEVSSIAFGAPGTFATCQESNNTYNDQAFPNDFMGPSLWPADMSIYAHSNPAAVRHNGGNDLGSHLDMLHESPFCMGIAWETDNVYWIYEGQSRSIARIDFRQDHGPGYDDHSDGIIQRYARNQVSRYTPGVPSHLVYDAESRLLYIADTGNHRIAVLDTTAGTPGAVQPSVEPGTVLQNMNMSEEVRALTGDDADLEAPSGLALHDGLLFVTDNRTSRITAFDLDGQRVDWLDTGLPRGALMGLMFDADGRLYLVDAVNDAVLRISAQP